MEVKRIELIGAPLQGELDEFIELFESRRARADIDVADYFPQPQHPRFTEIVVELLRVELEFAWNEGARDLVERYRRTYPRLLAEPANLVPLAFEEYRLRCQAGERVDKSAYERCFRLDVSQWPDFPPRAADGPTGTTGPIGGGDVVAADFPSPGDELLDFTLVAALGEGSFSRVFLAEQHGLAKRLVVLKVTRQLCLEADLLARLQHTNIVPIYSVHRVDGLQLVCMPYWGCCTLADALATLFRGDTPQASVPASGAALLSTVANHRADTLTRSAARGDLQATIQQQIAGAAPRNAIQKLKDCSYTEACLWIAMGIAEGLAHAHDRGVLHHDLKPANILLTDDGRPMILDFNLSHHATMSPTSQQMVGGTLPYMAPEHLRAMQGQAAAGPQSDVYSLGIVLFEMLAGRRPFADRTGRLDDVLPRMIEERETTRLDFGPHGSSIPRSVQSIIRTCLAADCRRRYQSAEQLREDLARHLADYPLRYAAERSLTVRLSKWARRHPRFASAFSAFAVSLCVLLAVVASWRVREQRLSQLAARDQFVEFQQTFARTRLELGAAQLESAFRGQGLQAAREQLAWYGLPANPQWETQARVRALDNRDRQQLKADLAELLYLAANAHLQQSRTIGDAAKRVATIRQAMMFNTAAAGLGSAAELPRAVCLQRAKLHDLLGDHEPAARWRQEADQRGRAGAADLYLAGLEHLSDGEFADAMACLNEAVQLQPRDFAAWFAYGNACAGANQLDRALTAYTTCAALRPQLPFAYFHRGVCRLELQDYDEAEADFDRALALRHDLPAALVNRALARQGLRQYQQAIDDLTQALERGSIETRVYLLRARLRQQIGDHDGAARDRMEGLRITPADELSWVARAMAQLPEDPEAALADLAEALRVNPHSYLALRNTAYVLSEHLSKLDEAIARLDQIIASRPADAEMLASRGVLLARNGQWQKAQQDAAAALAARQDARTLIHVACIYARTTAHQPNHADSAVDLVRRALLLEPHWVQTVTTDKDLGAIQSHPEFQQLVDAASRLCSE
jgi:serine/threonine protein kinase/Tfp pilus assembly protein PilF